MIVEIFPMHREEKNCIRREVGAAPRQGLQKELRG